MARLFGTDGIRGVANTELSCLLALKTGMAAAAIERKLNPRPLFLTGRDTRESGDMLEAALCAGICAAGGDVVRLGVVPTPAIAWLVPHFGANAGVMISASHNPYQYNGIKIFGPGGFKLTDAQEDEIEALIRADDLSPADNIGRIRRIHGTVEKYIKHIASCVSPLDELRIALDCANGSAARTAGPLFESLGASVELICAEPDGRNINDGCGSTHIGNLCRFLRENPGRFDIGFAFDGDADRCIAADENGNELDGDEIMAIIARRMKDEGRLKGGVIVATVMSNLGLSRFAVQNGMTVETTSVGDRYVLERMLEGGFSIGGEQSGHIILSEHMTTGDGQLTAAVLAETLKKSGAPASKLRAMKKYPQSETKISATPEMKARMSHPAAAEYIERQAQRISDGRLLARPSGTEPVIRIMAEGSDSEQIAQIVLECAGALPDILNSIQ